MGHAETNKSIDFASDPDVDKAVRTLAEQIFADSQATVPVDTGELKRSGFVDGQDSYYRVGYTAAHAPYVEYGTDDTRAQPFLEPAALRARG